MIAAGLAALALIGQPAGPVAQSEAGPAARVVQIGDETVVIPSGIWRLHGDFRAAPGEGPRPAVLLLNKANGDRRVYAALAGLLAQRGLSSLRLDLRGHGESVNAGRFIPFDQENNSRIFVDEGADVVVALAWLRARGAIDSTRLAIVGASYSGELAAESGRREGQYVRAYALLSPGSLSERSVMDMDGSGARWLLVYGSGERTPSVRAAADQVRALSRIGEVRVVDSAVHATDLLEDSSGLASSIADWLAEALGQTRRSPR